jgi:hypothetical protein
MEGCKMKKSLVMLLTLILVCAAFSLEGWAQSRTSTTEDELNLLDLLIARPAGVGAGIVGTGIFIVTLPFTIPTKSVNKASKMLISAPFHFSFSRPFPDGNEKTDF